MDKMKTSLISGAALFALTATASAGPMSVASSQIVAPPAPIEQAAYHHYYRHHVWYHHRYHRYVWHHGWHYGWYRARYHHHHYAWYRHHRYYYGWNPVGAAVSGAIGLATLPFAVAGGWPYYPYYYGYPYYY